MSGKNITRPLVMSAQVARSRNSPATPERLSLRRHLWGTLLPRSHQGRKGQVEDSEEKRRKPGDALECLLQHPLSFTSTIPEQMSLGRRREHLPCSWRVGEAEQERLYDAVKSTNKERNILIKLLKLIMCIHKKT